MKKTLTLLSLLLLTSCGGSSSNSNSTDPLTAPENSGIEQLGGNTNSISNGNVNALSEAGASEERKKYEEELTEAKKLMEEAKALDISKEKDQITSKIASVKEKASSLREMDDFFVEADSLLQEATTLEAHLSNFVQVSTLPVVSDFSLRGKDVELKGLFKTTSGIFAIANAGVYGPLFGKPEDVKAIDFPTGHLGTGAAYSLKYKESYVASIPGQMWKIKDGKLSAVSLEEGGAWYPGSEVWSYGKSLYLLDPVSKKLWKYEQGNDGVFKKQVLAIDDPEVKTSTIRSMSVDGNIYVLTDKELVKFTQGKRIPLETDTSLAKLSEASMMYTDQNSSSLYIFDPKAGRFLRFQKNAKGLSLTKEYTVQGNYKGFFPGSDGKTIYFYDQQKVYALTL